MQLEKKRGYMIMVGMFAVAALIAYLWRGWDAVLFVMVSSAFGALAGTLYGSYLKKDADRARQRIQNEGESTTRETEFPPE